MFRKNQRLIQKHVCLLTGPKEERDDLVNPYWIEDKALKRGEVDYMPGAEVQFFKDLIEKYLYPLLKNPQEQVLVSFLSHRAYLVCQSVDVCLKLV